MKHGTIRNVVLASYPGAGKTSLTEAFAFSTGIIPTMGSVLQAVRSGILNQKKYIDITH